MMNNTPTSLAHRLAVCSWSLQPDTPDQLLAHLHALEIPRVQLALGPLRENPAVWGDCGARCRDQGVTIVSGMIGTIGEDYTTLEAIRITGGVASDATWEQNLTNTRAAAALAHDLGLKLVTFHAGFLPHDPADPATIKLKDRVRQFAEIFAAHGIDLALETGQETAVELRAFLEELACPTLGVNFDPGNMILYGKGDPIAAMRELGPWIRQVHIKDAIATTVPGTWGEEVVAGSGQVPWPEFFATLDALGFAGNVCIEREAGNQRAADILTAKQLALRVSP